MVIVLLSFSSSQATKCLSLNDESCMFRPTFIDLYPIECKYYPFSYFQKYLFQKNNKC